MSMYDDSGYDLDDPKHPSFHDRYADWADDARKRAKENPPPLCASCEAQAERQAEQMRQRELRLGHALVAKRDAFMPAPGQPLPDIRLGDIVMVSLVAAAVEDMGYCETEGCANASRNAA